MFAQWASSIAPSFFAFSAPQSTSPSPPSPLPAIAFLGMLLYVMLRCALLDLNYGWSAGEMPEGCQRAHDWPQVTYLTLTACALARAHARTLTHLSGCCKRARNASYLIEIQQVCMSENESGYAIAAKTTKNAAATTLPILT